MPLNAVSVGEPGTSWADVLAASVENVGVDPYTIFTEALARVGSATIGPSDDGEHTSNCPCVTHNGGSGDAKPSLRWRQAADGQILFSCRASCEAQVILDSLELAFVQLRWSQTEYTYRTASREIAGIHVKKPAPGNKKKFWWETYDNGQRVKSRVTTWEPVLWALPDLLEAANRAHESGIPVHIWILEGEKDCITVADAFSQGWVSKEEADWAHLATTSGDGASSWSPELTQQILALSPAQITIVCDSDQAGTTRGTEVTAALRGANPTLSIDAINWLGQPATDATEAIHLYGRHWLQRSVPTAEADIYLWSSVETGWLSEGDAADIEGEATGKRVLHRTLNPGTQRVRKEAISKWPVRVNALTKDIDGHPVGWEIDMGPGGPALLKTTDLDGSHLEKWNSDHGLFIVPVRGLTAALRAYLGFHGANVASMTVYDHEGWVDDIRFITRTGILIGPEGESGMSALGGTNETANSSDWHYGLGSVEEASKHVAQLLTFRDLTESGPVLAWLAAVAVRPRALQASGSSFVPMLQIPGASGIGKTSFLRLATRLFGVSGNPISNVTSAGLVRTLALTTGVVWIDDFADYDDAIRDIIRGGITGAGRTRGTTSSERGIVRDEAYAALINSGEHAFAINERAMAQRSVVLEFVKGVQGRESRVTPGVSQYGELEALGVSRDDKGKGLSRFAGTIIRGLWTASATVDAAEQGRGSNSGVRGQAAWEFVRYGAHVLAQWLNDTGTPTERATRLQARITDICDDHARQAARREKTGEDVFLVQEIVPRYLTFARQRLDNAVHATTHDLTSEAIRTAIRIAWTDNFGESPRAVVMLYPPQLAQADEPRKPMAVAICAEVLYQWVTSYDGQRAGVGHDARHISSTGIAMQLKQVANKEIRDTDANASIRVRLGGNSLAPRYRVITEPEIIDWLCT